MISRILVAVDDSPGAMAAAGLAIELATKLRAELYVLAVIADGAVARLLSASGTGLRRAAAEAVLSHVKAMADTRKVRAATGQAEGEVAGRILAKAGSWQADLVVMGRNRGTGPDVGDIGSETRLVLEFATVPVAVVPAAKFGQGR